jgi:hypothetical protein
MKTSLRTIFLGFLIVIVMGLGTYSRAQDVPAEKSTAPAAATAPAVAAPAAEAAPPAGMKLIPTDLTADFNLSLYSQYIWRGYELSKDSLVIFPQLTVGYKGFAVTTWVDLDTRFKGDPNKSFKLQETDVIASYSNSYKPWKLNYTLGWILYDYQPTVGNANQTITDTKNQELFVTLGLDTLLKPTFSVYNEIEMGQAWYLQLGVAHSFAVYKDWSLDLAATASYMYNRSTADISAFHDGNISAGLKIPINSYLSIKPNLQYSFPLSQAAARKIKASSFDGHDNNFVYGGIIIDLAI